MVAMTTHAGEPTFGTRMTLEEWANMPEDDPGELVDGVLVEAEVPGPVHELIAVWLSTRLSVWGEARGVLVLGSGAKYRVSATRGRMPDVAVYLPDAPWPTRAALITVPPAIAVEIVSAAPRDARRDRVEKLAEYAEFDVRWYWIVDPQTRIIEIRELGRDGRYVNAAAASDGCLDPVPGCPGLVLDLDALWRNVDAIPEE